MARAVRFDLYGGRDVLYIADVEVPVPPAGEVLVEVRAAGINPGEAAIRAGALAERFPATFPSGQGSDLAGVIASVGEGVTEFAVGEEVLGWSWRRSSHAEYVAVPVAQLLRKPRELSWEVAAPNGIDAFIDLFGPQYVQLGADLGIEPSRIETIISREKAQELGAKAEGSVDASTTDVLSEMAELAASGQIEIPISATYPLERLRDAFAELEERHTHGKIVLIP